MYKARRHTLFGLYDLDLLTLYSVWQKNINSVSYYDSFQIRYSLFRYFCMISVRFDTSYVFEAARNTCLFWQRPNPPLVCGLWIRNLLGNSLLVSNTNIKYLKWLLLVFWLTFFIDIIYYIERCVLELEKRKTRWILKRVKYT